MRPIKLAWALSARWQPRLQFRQQVMTVIEVGLGQSDPHREGCLWVQAFPLAPWRR